MGQVGSITGEVSWVVGRPRLSLSLDVLEVFLLVVDVVVEMTVV